MRARRAESVEKIRMLPRGIGGGEVVVFVWVEFKSQAHRDRVNAKVMKDPRIQALCDPKKMPFDCARMIYGGFQVLVAG